MSGKDPSNKKDYSIDTGNGGENPGFSETQGPIPFDRRQGDQGPIPGQRRVRSEDPEPPEQPNARGRDKTVGNLPPVSEIGQRTGNYMLSYGYPRAGKSTFQSHLLRWITQGGEFSLNVAKNDSNDASRIAFNEWMRLWDANRFPESTERGMTKVVELRFRATPVSGRKKPLEFNILEMSGEDQRRVLPEAGRPSEMMEPVREYLSNRKINFLLVLLLDPARDGSENDILFLTLLDYLDANFPGLSERMSLLLLLSKPDTALAKMRSDRRASTEFHDLNVTDRMTPEHVNFYFDTYTPATISRLANWPGKWATAKLRVGSLPRTQGGASETYSDVDFDDAKRVFDWIFEAFTGAPPGKRLPTWLDKMLRDPE
ncbi:hypothetical protein [Palleronia caenipelagi]|uniref:Uncharacterized protein n=1 Tax=Palleronia caenipelagi TaxID=2489174 RepID=A0A547PMU6_9RHOB|nr:hypothetical protein [Palleronia caenipelagi]TRD15470.1 hypothetical protein FEV53_16275 [Palleronia caenipelagi]